MPLEDIQDLTGENSVADRERAYRKNLGCIFFMTSETLVNDIERLMVPVGRITLIILDEAHKATGQYSYC